MIDDVVLIQSLQNIATIQPGEKASIRNGLVTKDSNANPFFRWLSGDNRNMTLIVIQEIVEVSFVSMNPIVQNLISQVPSGLRNLKETYKTDKHTCKQIDVVLDRIKNYMV